MTDVYTAALLPTKPSSEYDSGFNHGFGTEASLPLTQSAPAWLTIPLDFVGLTSLYGIAISTLMQLEPFLVFPLVWWREFMFSQKYGGWLGNETSTSDRKYAAISDILFS